MRKLLLLTLCLAAAFIATAQDSVRTGRRKFDSTLFSDNNTPTRSDYLGEMEKTFQTLNQIPLTISSFVRLGEIHGRLDEEDSALAILKGKLASTDGNFNIRNLQMFNTLLDELDKNTDRFSKLLNGYDHRLDEVRAGIGGFRKDTLMRQIFRDSALRNSFIPQLQQLKGKWRLADSLVRVSTNEINALKARTSANEILIEELTFRIDEELKAVGSRAFGKERRYLYEPRTSRSRFSRDSLGRSFGDEQKLARYYFSNTRSNRFWLLLTGLLFFFWIRINFRSLKKLKSEHAVAGFRFTYIHPVPIAASLIFLLSLAPLFDLHAPAIYIESTQFLSMLILTVMFWKRLPRPLFRGWCIFIFLFLFLPLTRLLGLPIYLQRWANFVQNALSVCVGIYYLAKSPPSKDQPRLVRLAGVLYVLLNLLALVCNWWGRVTLSQIFGATAAYSFAQTVSLSVFIQSLVEAFLLQIQSSRIRKKYPEHFESAGITLSVQRFATFLSALLWLIVFTTNLNIFDALNDQLIEILSKPRLVGSFSFTLGGIILFMGIIWTANFLQRYIAYFFGDTGDDAAFDDKGQRSRLLVTRLILLTLGFLLAVAASGLPIDKITVILGALGVGIGLGLQSIVNNFVSGIILIFDRPLRIGDTVEIGDKKGRVKEIGIRSSTLLTEEGAEVIIPNGDVLSHNIVNWTLSNNYVRVQLAFTVDKPSDPGVLRPEAIREVIGKGENILDKKEPEILMGNISSKTLLIQVVFWCKDIVRSGFTTGEVRNRIYQYLESKGVNVVETKSP